jgi:hypothetical protein
MTIHKRSLVIASLFVLASVLYGVARDSSPALIFYVVEQSLLQKAPVGIDAASIHERFHARIAAAPDRDSQMQKLLQISKYLEKVQHLTFEQLDELLAINKSGEPARSRLGPDSLDNPGERIVERPLLSAAIK